jgi:hypothetical protein
MTVQPQNPELEALATKIAKATRLKDASAEMRQKGKVAVVMFDGRVLAYLRPRKKGVNVEVVGYGHRNSERVNCPDVKSAAAAVKTSGRRNPKENS